MVPGVDERQARRLPDLAVDDGVDEAALGEARDSQLMLATQRLRGVTRAAVRLSLSLYPVLVMAERVACLIGRRWPEAYIGKALRFHVVERLGKRLDLETRVARLPGGARLAVSLRDYALRDLYFRGAVAAQRGWLYEPETTRFILRWLRPGDTVFDIGANAGYYTAIAAGIVGPTGSVHAFEPNPRVAALLRQTVRLNNFDGRVQINEVAVNSTGRSTDLFLSTDPGATGTATTLPRPPQPVLPGLRVRAVTVDEYVAATGVRAIRLMKVDVEGAEVDVLAGAARTLELVRPETLIVEFFPEVLEDPPSTWRTLLDQTTRVGYQPFRVASDGSLSRLADAMPEWKVANVCFLAAPG